MARVYEGDEPYIFVSYAHADSAAVSPIVDALDAAGYRVWYDVGIELTSRFSVNIATHVHGCECLVPFISRTSLSSGWCRDEVVYALNLGKCILPIYLEDVSLDPELDMRLGGRQSLFWHGRSSDEEFYGSLFGASALKLCLREEAKTRGEARRRALAAAEAALLAPRQEEGVLRGALAELRLLPDAGTDKAVGELAGRLEGRLRWLEDERGRHELERERMDAEEARRAEGAQKAAEREERARGEAEDVRRVAAQRLSQARQATDRVRKERERKAAVGISAYSWAELKSIADKIAAAKSDDEGLAIAGSYGLVDAAGRLQGATKQLVLADGTEASVRIAGFRHDELASGGKSGITFEFADVPVNHRMNRKKTNSGGWERSEMREWLNSVFMVQLPSDLQGAVAAVRKRTNNVGKIAEGDVSCVTPTTDRLWLLSVPEVYGDLLAPVYNAEGTQYQLYSNQRVPTKFFEFCQKGGADSWWWLRSPDANGSRGFRNVISDGSWNWNVANSGWGVSPGFCF